MTDNIIIAELDPVVLNEACNKVIAALAGYPSGYKIAALHYCIKSFPAKYSIEEVRK